MGKIDGTIFSQGHSGEFWQFGQLQHDLFTKNETVYTISDLKKISGAMGYLLNQVQNYL